jgi:surfactin synthase thioesterase subunit
MARHLRVPLAMVRGEHSNVVRRHHAMSVKSMREGEYLSVPGGHMFPLEHPEDTAQMLKNLFSRWSTRGQSANDSQARPRARA